MLIAIIRAIGKCRYGPLGDEALSYEDFISDVDALVMGRHTFEKVLSFTPWPYEGTPVIVLTSRPLNVPAHLQGKVTLDAGPPDELIRKWADGGRRHLYIDGGITIQRFLQHGLISELIITHIPILLGGGIPLFGAIGREIRLSLIGAARSASGLVQVRYRVNPCRCASPPGPEISPR